MDTSFKVRRESASQIAGGSRARAADVVLISIGALIAALALADAEADRASELATVAYAAAFALVPFPAFRLYDASPGRSKRRVARVTALAWLLAQAGAALTMNVLLPAPNVSVHGYLLWAFASCVTLVASRLTARTTLACIGSVQESKQRLASVGKGMHRDAILKRIARMPSAGLRAAATPEPGGVSRSGRICVQCFRTLETFVQHVRAHSIPEAWLALPNRETRVVTTMIDVLRLTHHANRTARC